MTAAFQSRVERATVQTLRIVVGRMSDVGVDDLAIINTEWAQHVDHALLTFIEHGWHVSTDRVRDQLDPLIPNVGHALEAQLAAVRQNLRAISDTLWHHAREAVLRAGVDIDTRHEAVRSAANTARPWVNTVASTAFRGTLNCAAITQVRAASDDSTTKTWSTVGDERVRPEHAAVDGETIPLSDTFDVGGWSLDGPSDLNGPAEEIVGCRCWLEFDVARVV